MKVSILVVVALVALLGLLALARRKPQETDVSERCARVLLAAAKSAATPVSVSSSGAEVSIGGRRVRVSAHVENRQKAHNKFLVGVAVDLFVDGVLQPLTVGSLGIGDTEQEAEDTAMQEWAMLAGTALIASLASNDDAGLPIHSFVAHPGLTGTRGSAGPLPAHIEREMLGHFQTLVSTLQSSKSEFHSISLMLEVKQGGVAGGECRVDGEISQDALTAARSFPWPPSQADYLFKQFYVLRRK